MQNIDKIEVETIILPAMFQKSQQNIGQVFNGVPCWAKAAYNLLFCGVMFSFNISLISKIISYLNMERKFTVPFQCNSMCTQH